MHSSALRFKRLREKRGAIQSPRSEAARASQLSSFGTPSRWGIVRNAVSAFVPHVGLNGQGPGVNLLGRGVDPGPAPPANGPALASANDGSERYATLSTVGHDVS